MITPPDEATADPYAVIAALRQQLAERSAERDAALADKAELVKALSGQTAELVERTSGDHERIERQSAIVDVLKAMSASPDDTQPVFDLITRRAQELCHSTAAGIYERDGDLVQVRSVYGNNDPAGLAEFLKAFPMPMTRGLISCRAILDAQIVHIRDTDADEDLLPIVRGLGVKAMLSIPLMRDGVAVGAFSLNTQDPVGFTDSQVTLLKTFAEQAVIAITSAETYRALQERTTSLQQSLEYQTATSDVLKVISRSTFDLQPVLDTVAETAARLCNAEQAAIFRREGELWRLAANFGFPPEFEADWRELGAVPFDGNSPAAGWRSVRERQPVHIHDAAAVPGYMDTVGARQGKQRTTLAVPLLREGDVIGNIVLARQRVEPFTDRQIELLSTFADQAVIAIENTRLLTEQQEALEQQTATAEVLQVISQSGVALEKMLEAVIGTVMRLCSTDNGEIFRFEHGAYRMAACLGNSPDYLEIEKAQAILPGNGTLVGRAALAGQPVQILDAWSDPLYEATEDAKIGGWHTMLGVPLLREGAVIGVICTARTRIKPFTDKQIELVRAYADQAVIALENARLINETREALEQQTATAEVLQVINSSPGDLAPVFDAMLEKALRLCGAVYGMLGIYDGAHVRWEAFQGTSGSAFPTNVAAVEPGSALDRVAKGERLVHIPNLIDTDEYRNGTRTRVNFVKRTGARAGLWVALRKDDAVLGVILIYRQEARAFSDKQIALLENFAAQAVIAMENARLLDETREALEEQTATAEVLQVINASPGKLEPVFNSMIDKATRLCQAEYGGLLVRDGDVFRLFKSDGTEGQPFRADPGSGLAQMVGGASVVHIADVADTDEYRARVAPRVRLVEEFGARTTLFVALRQDNALLGVLTIYRRVVRPFTNRQIALVQNFAAQTVVAMENARLIAETREALEQQTATAEVLQVINSSPGDLGRVLN
jgi:GAF domain-containing protein